MPWQLSLKHLYHVVQLLKKLLKWIWIDEYCVNVPRDFWANFLCELSWKLIFFFLSVDLILIDMTKRGFSVYLESLNSIYIPSISRSLKKDFYWRRSCGSLFLEINVRQNFQLQMSNGCSNFYSIIIIIQFNIYRYASLAVSHWQVWDCLNIKFCLQLSA